MGKKVDEGSWWTARRIDNKTVPDDPVCGVQSPEKEPRTHTRTHAPARGRQAAGGRRRVTARALLFAGGVATDV